MPTLALMKVKRCEHTYVSPEDLHEQSTVALLVIVTDVTGYCSVTSEPLAVTQRFSGTTLICI